MSNVRQAAETWLRELKVAWESGDVERALRLFQVTREYYERPFRAGTTQREYRTYWNDIVGLKDIKFDYDIVAVEGQTCCVHWRNEFDEPTEGRHWLLDGIFLIDFDADGRCEVFRQWWFAKE